MKIRWTWVWLLIGNFATWAFAIWAVCALIGVARAEDSITCLGNQCVSTKDGKDTVRDLDLPFGLVNESGGDAVHLIADTCAPAPQPDKQAACDLAATCLSKTRRFIDTGATLESRERFIGHCILQGEIRERRDP